MPDPDYVGSPQDYLDPDFGCSPSKEAVRGLDGMIPLPPTTMPLCGFKSLDALKQMGRFARLLLKRPAAPCEPRANVPEKTPACGCQIAR